MGDQNRIYPMRLYATWEVDRTSTSSVPRLCIVVFDRLTVMRNFEQDLTSLIIAVKLQGYKRTLRSNEINVAVNNGIIDADLDITFTLQYPHFIKRKSINLFVMLQRRKKYKTKTILGFKTLAVGVINLNQVLQSCSTSIIGRELNLYHSLSNENGEKGNNDPVAKLYLNTLTTQPLELDDSKTKGAGLGGQFESDDDDDDSTPNEDVVPAAGTAAACIMEADRVERRRRRQHAARRHHSRQGGESLGGRALAAVVAASSSSTAAAAGDRRKTTPVAARRWQQKNLKQRFVALLKKFRIAEEALATVDPEEDDEELDDDDDEAAMLDAEQAVAAAGRRPLSERKREEIHALLDDLENLSDSGPECDAQGDAISVKSAPKPQLRPYFNSTNDVTQTGASFPLEIPSEESKDSGDSQTGGEADTTEDDPADFSEDIADPSRLFGVAACVAAAASNVVGSKIKQDSLEIERKYSGQKPRRATPGRMASSDALLQGADKKASSATAASSSKSVHPVVSASLSPQTSTIGTSAAVKTPRRPLSHKPAAEQMASAFSGDDFLTSSSQQQPVIFVGATDVSAQNFVTYLASSKELSVNNKVGCKLFVLSTLNDVKTILNALLLRLQRFCNVNAVQPPCLKLVLIGGDKFLATCLRAYVECLAPKPNEWLHYLRFYPIAQTGCTINRYLCSLDRSYAQLFCSSSSAAAVMSPGSTVITSPLGQASPALVSAGWWDKTEMTSQEMHDWTAKIGKFLNGARQAVNLPVAEVMLQLQEKGLLAEASQIFVPFIGDVRLGSSLSPSEMSDSVNLEASGNFSNLSSGQSPSQAVSPGGVQIQQGQQQEISPPSSPKSTPDFVGSKNQHHLVGWNLSPSTDCQDLQIEYWAVVPPCSSSAAPATSLAAAGNPSSSGNNVISSLSSSASQTTTTTGRRPTDVMLSSSLGSGLPSSLQSASANLSSSNVVGGGQANMPGAGGLSQLSVSSTLPSSVVATSASQLVVKSSLKAAFRQLQVARLPALFLLLNQQQKNSVESGVAAGACASSYLSLQFIREKKRDKGVLLKLGMKNKEKDPVEKKHNVENISRLICSTTKQHGAMRIFIDGVEWNKVKFFQISTQWQTHVKILPVAVFGID